MKQISRDHLYSINSPLSSQGTPGTVHKQKLQNEYQKLQIKRSKYKIKFTKADIDWNITKDDIGKKLENSPKRWRDKSYWKLPENIRGIVDLNQIRMGEKTDFYYMLQSVNDKINVF